MTLEVRKADPENFDPHSRVADVASRHPSTVRVFQRHGIDFCCGGKRPLEQAAREQGLDFEVLAGELRSATEAPEAEERNWAEAPLAELIDHIVGHYHGKLRQELPRLLTMAEKVHSVHGKKHSELTEILQTFRMLKGEMEMHTAKEEQVLFPLVRQMERAEVDGLSLEEFSAFGGGHCATVAMPILVMEAEHDQAAEALATLRRLTGGFTPPEGACNTFRGLYHGLAELESDTHRHIHLENNVLFPRAAELEKRLQAEPAQAL